MPKIYKNKKKHINPRYFLNESREETPQGKIDLFNSPQGQNQWKMAQNDFLDMAAGGDAAGVRHNYYPEWTDDMFQQVVDGVEGSKEASTPPWESPGSSAQSPMGRAKGLAQQGMAANDPSGLSTEELQAKIEALQAELSNRNTQAIDEINTSDHDALSHSYTSKEDPLSRLSDDQLSDMSVDELEGLWLQYKSKRSALPADYEKNATDVKRIEGALEATGEWKHPYASQDGDMADPWMGGQ